MTFRPLAPRERLACAGYALCMVASMIAARYSHPGSRWEDLADAAHGFFIVGSLGFAFMWLRVRGGRRCVR